MAACVASAAAADASSALLVAHHGEAAPGHAHASHAPPCRPADVSATLSLTPVGTSSTTLAGAVVLRNQSALSCSLQGVPTVRVVNSTGQTIPVYQAPLSIKQAPVVELSGTGGSGGNPVLGVSITWSDWNCKAGSFALDVRFKGWATAIEAPWGTTGSSASPCNAAGETLYVGPVTRALPPT